MYTLRKYQKYASDRGYEALTKSRPQPFLMVLGTGAGKSIVIADMVHRLNDNVLVLQPSKELVAQNYEKMMAYEPDFEVGVYCAGLGRKEIKQVTYATIQSIHRKPEDFMLFRYIIVDECHGVDPAGFDDGTGAKRRKQPGMYAKFFEALGTRRICGLTATPYRLEQRYYYQGDEKKYTAQLKMLNRIYPFFFKSIVCLIETDKLIEHGFLSPIVYRQVQLDGFSSLRINSTGQDYDVDSVQEFWENDTRLEKLATVIQKIDAECQRNLVFCSSRLQARRTKAMLEAMVIRAEMVDGETPPKERDALVASYRAGDFKHMLNVGVFTTGFDVPELDSVVLARPTMSLALYYQMVGRGVRLDPARPEKKLRVYDLVRVSQKLGRVETINIRKEVDPATGKPTWKDEVVSEAGVMTNVPLFTFSVNKD